MDNKILDNKTIKKEVYFKYDDNKVIKGTVNKYIRKIINTPRNKNLNKNYKMLNLTELGGDS